MEQEILGLFDKWNATLQTGDPKQVAAMYAKDGEGVLLPTVSPLVRHNHAEIEDYFVHFLAKNPVGTITESNVRVYGDIAINSGLYTFALDGDESRVEVDARFTYVYKKEGDDWLILEHHSSLLP
ncbi:MAG TPA: SgcJ/EcaC family oxidoreductase [Sulfurovum sp.]|nr:SgcJ/EcaC family oxidoreductase [Sulfurovum sp.]HIM93498.1 SgcJ/EcaC family oxidoreductase [Campylobacterales bacterium]